MTNATPSGRFDVLVIGGGMLGSAIAYGCATKGARTLLLDGGDLDLRAARGNFGLVWSQGKGVGMPAYAAWTKPKASTAGPPSASKWPPPPARTSPTPTPAASTSSSAKQDLEERRAKLHRMHNQAGGPATPVQLLDRADLEALLPNTPLGPIRPRRHLLPPPTAT